MCFLPSKECVPKINDLVDKKNFIIADKNKNQGSD